MATTLYRGLGGVNRTAADADKVGMERPWVSVITPTYNRKSELRRCIDSVAAQDYPRIEHIIVDDGSTDGTWEELRPAYAAGQAAGRMIWMRQANAGPGRARNRGLCRARGEFIAYLDSDDEFLFDHISTLIEPLLNDPEIGVAYSKSIEILRGPDSRVIQTRINRSGPVDVIELRYKNRIPINILHRRSLMDRAGMFTTEFVGLEDWDFLVRLSEIAPFRFVDRVTSKLNIAPASPRVTQMVGSEQYRLVRDRILRREETDAAISPVIRDLIDASDETIFRPTLNACRDRAPGPPDVPSLRLDVLMKNNGKDICRILHGFYENYSGAFDLRFVDAGSRDGSGSLFDKVRRIFSRHGLDAPTCVVAAGGERPAGAGDAGTWGAGVADPPARVSRGAGWSGWLHPSAASSLELIRSIASAVDGNISPEESLSTLAAHWGGLDGYFSAGPRRLPMMIRRLRGVDVDSGGSPHAELLNSLIDDPRAVGIFGPLESGIDWPAPGVPALGAPEAQARPAPAGWRRMIEESIARVEVPAAYQNNLRDLLDHDAWLAALGAAVYHLDSRPAVQLESDLAARLSELPADETAVLMFGLGRELDAVLRRAPRARIIVFEQDARMLRAWLMQADIRQVLESGRVRLFIGPAAWPAVLAAAPAAARLFYLDGVEHGYASWIDAYYAARSGRPDRAA